MVIFTRTKGFTTEKRNEESKKIQQHFWSAQRGNGDCWNYVRSDGIFGVFEVWR